MNQKIKKQQAALQYALSCLNTIEEAEKQIESGRHVNHYKTVRSDAIHFYIHTLAEIVEASIEFDATEKPFDQRLKDHLVNIGI